MTPLLYQIAISSLEPSSISYPFRKLFRDKKINFRMAEVIKVEPTTQRPYLSDDTILSYDHLVFVKHKVHVNEFPALLIWLFIHVASLVNYNNKVRTLYSWIVAYLTRDQVFRMIFRT